MKSKYIYIVLLNNLIQFKNNGHMVQIKLLYAAVVILKAKMKFEKIVLQFCLTSWKWLESVFLFFYTKCFLRITCDRIKAPIRIFVCLNPFHAALHKLSWKKILSRRKWINIYTKEKEYSDSVVLKIYGVQFENDNTIRLYNALKRILFT